MKKYICVIIVVWLELLDLKWESYGNLNVDLESTWTEAK